MEAARYVPKRIFVIRISHIYKCAIWNSFPRSSHIIIILTGVQVNSCLFMYQIFVWIIVRIQIDVYKNIFISI